MLLDVRVKRGKDVGSGHHLVTAFIKLKLRSAGRRMMAQRRFDTERLHDPKVKSAFVLHVKNRFQALQNLEEEGIDSGTEINRRWERVASVCRESSKECLGLRQRGKRREWLTADTWRAINNRHTLRKKFTDAKSEGLCKRYQQQYSEADRQVKCLTRVDKRAYIDGLAARGRGCSET